MRYQLRIAIVILVSLWLLSLLAVRSAAAAATGTLTGAITDPSGAVIPGASVRVTSAAGETREVPTGLDGRYVLAGLAPGKYTVSITAPDLAPFQRAGVEVKSGATLILDAGLELSVTKEEITVSDTNKVDVDPSSNIGAIVLKGSDLDALPDDPDELQADLEALAGPAAGPNGGQIYIDGFSGGSLPPKSSIREIRINQNPFSAEYDRMGYGRIEIFTKPGTDKFHGQAFFNFGDSLFNSRNPFAPDKPAYQTRMMDASVGGPLSRRASFFVNAERHAVDETAVVNALTLDPSLNVTAFRQTVMNPMTRTSFSPRLDYQLSPNHTLAARYSFTQMGRLNQGAGEFSLPSRAYDTSSRDHTLQLTETAVLSPKAINETRFQFIRRENQQTPGSADPTIMVLGAFTGGGANVGQSYTTQDHFEWQNVTTVTRGTHVVKFGGRLREMSQSGSYMQGYNGTFTFTSLEAYRITLAGLSQGLTLAQIRAAGGGPSQFSITGGNPLASVRQWDAGLFAQDDWRVRPNFTLNLGLRYETQTHIGDHLDLAPRVGFAWGLGGKGQPKTVIRGGLGLFYDRVGESLTLEALRLNGINQQQFLVALPEFYPQVPSVETLAANRLPSAIRELDTGLRTPYVAQVALSLERQLPKNTSLSITYANSRGLHVLRSRNINAPAPGAYDPLNPASAVRPYEGLGDIYLYESTGIFKQHQLIANVSARVSPKLTLFGFYALSQAESNADGAGSFPANQYDLTREWGRAGFDVRHRAALGGSLTTPFGLRFSPFITASSGRPFDITVGRDLNGDSLFNDRPAFATDLTRASVISTPYGAFDTNPLPGQTVIPRNWGNGPGEFAVNLRLSRSFGFGGETSASPRSQTEGGFQGPPPGRAGGPGAGGGPRGGGPGGHMGPGGGPRGGPGGMFGEAASGKRYSLTFSISARNLLNHVNLGLPVGNLSSPLFGTSTTLAGGFGPGGSATANRRIEMQVRFTF